MKDQSLYDKFAKSFGDMISDIREKLVEEPWYGRVVNEREPLTIQWPESKEAQTTDRADPKRDREPERDIDR